MFRSVLEKVFVANGYGDIKNLKPKISKACEERIISPSREIQVDKEIRVLGNEILHDEWEEKTKEDVELAHEYSQRILEDFYGVRDVIEEQLRELGRISDNNTSS